MADAICPCGKPVVKYRKRCSKCEWASRPKQPCVKCGNSTGWLAGDCRAKDSMCRNCKRKPCSVDRCQRNAKARGMCKHHYSKLNQYTDDTSRQCYIDGCRRVRASKLGFCCSHYSSRVYRQTPIGREKKREQSSQRRAKQQNAFVALVSMADVFRLDSGRCYLCRKRCDPSAPLNHPRQPTIDHVIPLANGGTHEPSNVRLACRKCNCAKAHRGGGEQFALAITI